MVHGAVLEKGKGFNAIPREENIRADTLSKFGAMASGINNKGFPS